MEKESIWQKLGFIKKEIPFAKNKPTKHAFRPAAGSYYNSFAVSFNGEKNLGEVGPIKNYYLDYDALRSRSWQSYLESEISKTVLDKFVLWIISKGLKLQSNPDRLVLSSEGINIEPETFNTITEARFGIWSKSTMCDYAGINNLHTIAREAYKNTKIGGDILVVQSLINNVLKIKTYDGAHIKSPMYGTDQYAQILKNGNTLVHGIEMNDNGEHVAYWIQKKDLSYERIESTNSIGLKQAFLVYGNRYRLDNHRGLPLISVSLETLKKLERYKEAAVGSAEERQKIAYFIEHGRSSDGSSPFLNQMAAALNADGDDADLPATDDGKLLANHITATTNKQTFNLTQDSTIKAVDSKQEMFFKEFYGTNSDIICASIGIPPNVAFSIYNDSFSASRAATKDWEHTITVNREDFSLQFFQPIYNFWLHTEILKNKIQAPGYLLSFYNGNLMALEAYRSCRFTGPMFPHIDPLKEVKAEREKLGELAVNLPLTTLEAATEALNGGDSSSNMEQFAQELLKASSLKIEAQKTPA